MRSIIIGLSLIFFTLSGTIIYRALELPTHASMFNVPLTDIPLTEEKNLAHAPITSPNIISNPIAEPSEITGNLTEDQVVADTAAINSETPSIQPKSESENPEKPIENISKTTDIEHHPRILTVFDGKAFRSGQDVVSEAAASKIEKLINEISVFPNSHILIGGHTDNIPTGSSRRNNMNLSVRRANAIAKILVSRGIAQERISVIGYGDTHPIDTNRTEEGRAKNRRVEVKLMLKEGEN